MTPASDDAAKSRSTSIDGATRAADGAGVAAALGEAVGDGEATGDGEAFGDGDAEADGDRDPDADGDKDADGDTDGDGEGDTEACGSALGGGVSARATVDSGPITATASAKRTVCATRTGICKGDARRYAVACRSCNERFATS